MLKYRDLFHALFNRRMLICCCTGFSSGLPLYVFITLIPVWLHTEGLSLTEISLFSLVGMPYNWKFLWAPFLDWIVPGSLGRRRSWMLLTQILLFLVMALLGIFHVKENLWMIVLVSGFMVIFSATQDIVIDAYRRELLSDAELGLGNSTYVNAYRIAGLIPGSLSLILADHMDWSSVFVITAGFMSIGIITTFFLSEVHSHTVPETWQSAIILPFQEFIQRNCVKQTLYILAFMFLYKLGDNMAVALAGPFYLDMGYSKTQIALVAKQAGLWPMIIGGMLGGLIMVRIGINRSLWLFGMVQMISILGFYGLAITPGSSIVLLALVISFEYLGVGLGAAAFVAFIARSTSRAYAATQLALLTALAALPRTFAGAVTGVLVDHLGWSKFFLLCTILAVPGMLLLFKVAPWSEKPSS